MASSRTQVYLTDQQRRRLDDRGRREGVTLAHLIREAVDSYLSEDELSADDALDETFGVLPDLDVPSRSEWDRG